MPIVGVMQNWVSLRLPVALDIRLITLSRWHSLSWISKFWTEILRRYDFCNINVLINFKTSNVTIVTVIFLNVKLGVLSRFIKEKVMENDSRKYMICNDKYADVALPCL